MTTPQKKISLDEYRELLRYSLKAQGITSQRYWRYHTLAYNAETPRYLAARGYEAGLDEEDAMPIVEEVVAELPLVEHDRPVRWRVVFDVGAAYDYYPGVEEQIYTARPSYGEIPNGKLEPVPGWPGVYYKKGKRRYLRPWEEKSAVADSPERIIEFEAHRMQQRVLALKKKLSEFRIAELLKT